MSDYDIETYFPECNGLDMKIRITADCDHVGPFDLLDDPIELEWVRYLDLETDQTIDSPRVTYQGKGNDRDYELVGRADGGDWYRLTWTKSSRQTAKEWGIDNDSAIEQIKSTLEWYRRYMNGDIECLSLGVIVEIDGEEYGSDYLGGCFLEQSQDAVDTVIEYDMVWEAINSALENLKLKVA